MRHILLALAALSIATTADAGVIYVKKGATGANNGTSWADAFAELRDALPASALNDELWIAEGTYTPVNFASSFVVSGRKLYGGFIGTETQLDQRDWAAHPTILTGDILGDDVGFGGADNCTHVVRCSTQTSRLDGLVIEGGVALGSGSDGQGAGLYCDGSSPGADLALVNVILRRNIARRGAAAYASEGFVQVLGCLFTGNHAQGQGGADGCGGLMTAGNGYSTVYLSTFSNNSQSQAGAQIASAYVDPNGFGAGQSIFWANTAPSAFLGTDFWSCLVDTQVGPGLCSSCLSTDPLFVSPSTGDYRLTASSPCIDYYTFTGTVQPSRDLGGLRRVLVDPSQPPFIANRVDLGAFEYATDCNGTGAPDYLETTQGTVRDLNANEVPDSCEPIGSSICLGDGTGAACPCSNFGTGGRGCENSSNTGGGRIYAIGMAKVTNDTLLLHVDGLGPTAPALFFQGNGLDLVGGATGLPFGDGLRCVFGQILRLPIKNCVNGQVSTGSGVPGDVDISILGAPVTPGTRYYQAWYRDSAPFCTPAFYNMTNAVQITWTP